MASALDSTALTQWLLSNGHFWSEHKKCLPVSRLLSFPCQAHGTTRTGADFLTHKEGRGGNGI